ncbi:hypothetical protein AVEN_210130-1 [Araneus ventricosus]|uniref:Uncharacterized protein n=1 Tax=Araneus ventricosus TaxID=182803 RepID=A0A4Y2MHG1_ARAVE|nr:hypothetical protein AVEN_210130-1 [Araneus ventricosus]
MEFIDPMFMVKQKDHKLSAVPHKQYKRSFEASNVLSCEHQKSPDLFRPPRNSGPPHKTRHRIFFLRDSEIERPARYFEFQLGQQEIRSIILFFAVLVCQE